MSPPDLNNDLDRSIGEESNEKRKHLYRLIKISSISSLPSPPVVVIIRSKNFIFHARGYPQEDEHLKYEIWKMAVFRRTSINEVQCAAATASTICLATGWKRALDRDVTIVRYGGITIRV